MIALFVRNWKPLAWRGALAIAFGTVAFLWPQMTLAALVLIFGAYALLDGFVAIALGARYGVHEYAWLFVLEGFGGVGVGLAIFLWTGSAAALVVQLIGFWAVATGILEIFAGIRLSELLLDIAGAASVLLGWAILFRPAVGAVLLVDLLGAYALVFGAAMLAQSMRIRRLLRHVKPIDGEPGPGAGEDEEKLSLSHREAEERQ